MEKWRQYQNENFVIVKAQIARPSSPHSRENIVHYNFLKLYFIRCKMTYVSSLTYVQTGMLTTLPYYSFKSYLEIPSYTELLFIDMLFALKHLKWWKRPICI